ncbi:hypothetical protein [Streptomyces tanashiensis]|uniref:Uncharacterized protein n=1 Tax=Streptomyces tanashiensis TaxID=67367 RepID=A0ABY6QSE0_9ACTN|nr:hypothetical protein [Streptomyces tanashiensis]UZX20391.1 hypothetical protein LDH80_06560 [Streptomyces tanashiensis]
MIAVVGHGDLTAPTLALLEAELRARLAVFATTGGAGLVRAGQGLPVAVGRAARAAGLALVTALPAKAGLPALLREWNHRAAGELLMLSQRVRLLDYDPSSHRSCAGADESLIRSCSRVLAVWDGTPSSAHDATAELVTFARRQSIDVDVVWPAGADRMPSVG